MIPRAHAGASQDREGRQGRVAAAAAAAETREGAHGHEHVARAVVDVVHLGASLPTRELKQRGPGPARTQRGDQGQRRVGAHHS